MVVEVAFALPSETVFDYWADFPVKEGSRVWVELGKRKLTGIVVKSFKSKKPSRKLKNVLEILDRSPALSADMLEFSRILSSRYFYSQGEILKTFLPPALRGRKKLNIDFPVREKTKPLRRKAKVKTVYVQEEYYKQQRFSYYRGLIEEKIKNNQCVIICLPQKHDLAIWEGFLSRSFPGNYLIFSSRQPVKAQLENWVSARLEKKKIAIGTRSVIFAPFDNLGAVIVEKESFYGHYHPEKPFYHTRDVAVFLCRQKGADLVLAGDVMSVEAYYLCRRQEKVSFAGKSRVKAHIVDLRNYKKGFLLNPILKEVLRKNLESKKRTLIFWDKKGFSRIAQCSFCGEVLTCPNCNIGLNYSKTKKIFQCLRCGYVEKAASLCKKCGKGHYVFKGTGVERIGQNLNKLFPRAKVAVIEGRLQKNIGNADITAATEKIFYADSSGRCFHSVAVLGIGRIFSRPGYNSAEEAFILLKRLESLAAEEILIFTRIPEYYPLKALFKESSWFYRKELADRRKLFYPPFGFFANISVRGKTEKNALNKAELLAGILKEQALTREQTGVFGPFKGLPYKLRKKYYYSIFVKARGFNSLKSVLKYSLAKVRLPGVQVSIAVK